MRRLILATGFVVISTFCQAQKKQIKLYIQQIAANKVYIEYLQNGYSIVKSGLNTIGNIKNGHFSLDIDFFDGLEKINPKIRHCSKVADVIALNIQIVKRTKKLIIEARNSEQLTEQEIQYAAKVVDALLINCSALVDELASLLANSELKMSDDERIKRIDALYIQMRDNYSFVNYFSGELQILQLQKDREMRDVNTLRDLINN